MKFRITDDMKKKIFVYGSSLSIAVLVSMFFLYFEQVMDVFSFILTLCAPFLFGLFIAFILDNPSIWIETKVFGKLHIKDSKKRILSIVVAFILFLLFIFLFLYTMIPSLIDSFMQFSSNFSRYMQNLISLLEEAGTEFHVSVSDIESFLLNLNILDTLTSAITKYLPEIAVYSYTIIRFLINFILAVVSAFYFLLDKDSLIRMVKKLNYALFDKSIANFFTAWTNDAKLVFQKYIVGSIIDALIIGVSCYIGVALMRIPYAPMIGFVVGVTNIIPVFGPFIGAIPVIVLLILIEPIYALMFAVFILVLQQIDGNVIKPIVLGDQLGISGFWILFSVTVGGGVGGVIGMFLGVPIFTLIYTAITDFSENVLAKKHIEITEKKGTVD